MNKTDERDNMQSPLKDCAMSASLLKPSYLLAILCGAALMLAIVRLPASNPQPPHHVYELRLYHVKRAKWTHSKRALAITLTHSSSGIHEKHRLLVARRCAGFSKSVYLHFGASQPTGGGEELGCLPS